MNYQKQAIAIRPAMLRDSSALASLMSQLGYAVSKDLISEKLGRFSRAAGDEVFVAEFEGNVVGVVSCHITSLFHQAGSSGRITSLVIDQGCRGMGVGSQLVQRAESFFRDSGCVKSEVTSGDQRTVAHEFYKSCGYAEDERRFIKHYQ